MKKFLCAAALAAMTIVDPAAAAAQQRDSTAIGTAATEYVIYTHYAGAAKRLVGPGGRLLAEARRIQDFIRALGGTDGDVPPDNASPEAWDAAVLNVLGRQGWQLIGCQLYDLPASGSLLTRCHLKRSALQLQSEP